MGSAIRVPTEADIARVVLREDEIMTINRRLAAEIARDYHGKKVIAVTIMKGAMYFTCDLLREVHRIDPSIVVVQDMMVLSSYGENFQSSGEVKIVTDLKMPIKGEDVLILEDIVDTGSSMQHLLEILNTREPGSLRVCTLLNKPSRRRPELAGLKLDYIGVDIPNDYVIGYGLDSQELCRHRPEIVALKESFYRRE